MSTPRETRQTTAHSQAVKMHGQSVHRLRMRPDLFAIFVYVMVAGAIAAQVALLAWLSRS